MLSLHAVFILCFVMTSPVPSQSVHQPRVSRLETPLLADPGAGSSGLGPDSTAAL